MNPPGRSRRPRPDRRLTFCSPVRQGSRLRAVAAIDATGTERLILADPQGINTAAEYHAGCPAGPHEQTGPLPDEIWSRIWARPAPPDLLRTSQPPRSAMPIGRRPPRPGVATTSTWRPRPLRPRGAPEDERNDEVLRPVFTLGTFSVRTIDCSGTFYAVATISVR